MITAQVGKAMATAVTRHNSNREEILRKREERLSILKKAIEIINDTPQWTNGQEAVLYSGTLQGKPAKVYLSNDKEGINLYLQVESRKSEPFRVGYFNPVLGLVISKLANEQSYLSWNWATRRMMSK